jgi:hypothetical protein
MRIPLFATRVPALAIARFVNERGAAYSGEILDEFLISQSTLRRRRPELRRFGISFVERGRGSLYVAAGLAHQLPTNYPPTPIPHEYEGSAKGSSVGESTGARA